jgi:hypothetical protein
MAGNAKTRARKDKAKDKSVRWLSRFRRDIDKILSTGDVPTHYVGGGQAYTKGKQKPTLGERIRPHIRKVLGTSV